MPELAPDLGPEVVGAGIFLALLFRLFVQFTELTLIPLLPLLFALSKYSFVVPDQFLDVNSAVFEDSGFVDGGDKDAPGEDFRDSNLLDEALLTFGGLAQAPCSTGALVSVFTGGGGISSGLTDDEGMGDVFLGGGTRLLPGADNVCCGFDDTAEYEYFPDLPCAWVEVFLYL